MRRYLWQGFYDFICWLYPQVQWKVMNYGYAVFNDDGKIIKNLNPEFEEERFPLQLYHFVATCSLLIIFFLFRFKLSEKLKILMVKMFWRLAQEEEVVLIISPLI